MAAEKIFLVGNVMIDSLLRHRETGGEITDSRPPGHAAEWIGLPRLRSAHAAPALERGRSQDAARDSRAQSARSLREFPVFFPMHPRTRKNIESFGLQRYLANAAGRNDAGIVPLDPLGYLDFLSLNDRARIVLTDSGGVQEETTVLGVPCLTLRENTERPATVEQGSNQVVGTSTERIAAAAQAVLRQPERKYPRPRLWDGKAASRIIAILREQLL